MYEDGPILTIISRDVSKIIREVKVKDCKPIAVPDQSIPLSEYKECQCIAYAQIPGGKDEIVAKANEIRYGE